MDIEQRYRDNIEALKERGSDLKAEIILDIFRGYPDDDGGEPVPLADVQSYAYDKMQQGAYPKTTLANTRRSLYDSDSGSYGFFRHSKRGVKNYLLMTELGKEFNSWLFTPGNIWGKPVVKAKRKNEEKPYFEGGVVNTHLPTEPIVMDNVSANKHGLLLAYVPAGVDIVWVEEIEQEDGSVKKKPHKIKRKSEEKVLSPEEAKILELKARLRELGEDI